jgi:hypothetical protein
MIYMQRHTGYPCRGTQGIHARTKGINADIYPDNMSVCCPPTTCPSLFIILGHGRLAGDLHSYFVGPQQATDNLLPSLRWPSLGGKWCGGLRHYMAKRPGASR